MANQPIYLSGKIMTEQFEDAVIELAFSSRDLTRQLLFEFGQMTECFCCGLRSLNPIDPLNHSETCPVARVYAAIEEVRKQAHL